MAPLQNSAIERPVALFEVELIIFGTIDSSAVRRSICVLAETARGARRICLSCYRRAEVKRTRKAGSTLNLVETLWNPALKQSAIQEMDRL